MTPPPTSPEPIDFGIYIPQVGVSYQEVREQALRCESLGYSSYWLFDHLYTPRLKDQPMLEGWTLATALLAESTDLRVGHLVLNNNLRHPALLAKMAATLDVISGGRFEIGLGSGSYEDEHRELGLPWGSLGERSARLSESLKIITSMLAGEGTSFNGKYYQVTDLPCVPRAVQRPRPPIVVGGIGASSTLPIVAQFADIWNIPTYGLGLWQDRVKTLEACCDSIGRDPRSIRRSLEAVLVLAPNAAAVSEALGRAQRRYSAPAWGLEEGGFIGTPSQILDRIGTLIDQGISHFVLFPSDRGKQEILDLFAEEVMAYVPNVRNTSASNPNHSHIL